MQIFTEEQHFSPGSLRNDEDNSNVNATNQWFDWLNEEK